MRVLHICQRDDAAAGGAVRVAVEFVKHLYKYDIDVHCLFLYGYPGVFQQELGKNRSHYLYIRDSRDILGLLQFPFFIKKFQPDIIHCHDGLTWPRLFLLGFPNLIKVTHAHSNISEKNDIKSFFNIYLQKISTDFCVCITKVIQSNWLAKVGYKIDQSIVIYNGVNLNKFFPKTLETTHNARLELDLPTSSDVKIIGFVGRLNCEMKGVDDFIRVIAQLPSNFYGLIAGSGPDASLLSNLAISLGISDRIIFLGLCLNVVPVYHAIDMFCMTSHWEPFGLVVAEALACEVPVIGFPCSGGINELLSSNTGIVLPERNVSLMANTILDTIVSPEQWSNKLQFAREQLKSSFDWNENCKKLASLYQELDKDNH